MKTTTFRWTVLLVVNIGLWCMLGFYQTSSAGSRDPQLPFANSVAQREAIVEQLKELNQNVKQQNALLQSGRLKVIVVDQQQH